MRKVIFTKKIKDITIDSSGKKTLVVYHRMYQKPIVKNAVFVDWQQFKEDYFKYEVDQFVLVGLNKIITPANRCSMVNDYLQVMTRSIPKVVIDTSPFVGEPWRVWYHYSVCFGEWLGVNYSYPIEGEWRKWAYYETNHCKLSSDNLSVFIKDTESYLRKLVTSFDFYELDKRRLDFYKEIKKMVFKQFDTPKLLINNILSLCNKHFDIEVDFDSYLSNRTIELPNIGIYRYLAEENKRRMNIYNCFTNESL